MGGRTVVTADKVLLAILALGLTTFVVLHTVVLMDSPRLGTFDLFRTTWLFGLAVVALATGYAVFSDGHREGR